MGTNFTTISQSLYNTARSSTLNQQYLYSAFLEKAFPVYDTGKVFRKYLDKKGIDISTPNAVSELAKRGHYKSDTLKKILNNEMNLNRNDIIRLCFLLKLDFKEANQFLLDFRQCSFHLRSFDDLIYAFHLREGLSFEDATDTIKKYKKIYSQKPEGSEAINYGKQATDKMISESNTVYLENRLTDTSFSLKELQSFLDTDGKTILSEISLTATNRYRELINDLKDELTFSKQDLELYNDRQFSDTDLVHLLSGDMKSDIRKEYDIIDNKGFLSDKSTLSRLYNQIFKVTRNNLLIVLLSHISIIEFTDWENEWEDNESIQTSFTIREYCFDKAVEYLNNQLEYCCFPPLQPRVPLDYVILSSLTSERPNNDFVDNWVSFIQK